MTQVKEKFWNGTVNRFDDFGNQITNILIDGKTKQGPWATMSQESYDKFGVGQFGVGYGQKYEKQEDGRFKKVAG